MITIVYGLQYGDEGKGHLVDFLSENVDLCVRYQGGDNAGHTVINKYGTFKLHLVPSGIFNPKTTCLLGTGMVVNPEALLEEITLLKSAGVSTLKLMVSSRAHILQQSHIITDQATSQQTIGTTGKGIGPAYADKINRTGKRFASYKGDLQIVDAHKIIQPFLNKRILFEGQLGVMRDLDWGVYPFVTSSNTLPSHAFTSNGIPSSPSTNIGVLKAYTTAVGAGPFPTELQDDTGDLLRKIGQEYGATTGRPRRCGWLDLVALKYACEITKPKYLALTKLDVLDSFREILVCKSYKRGSVLWDSFPDRHLKSMEPIYATLPGWNELTSDLHVSQLPTNLRKYVAYIEEALDTQVKYVSVGPHRDDILELE